MGLSLLEVVAAGSELAAHARLVNGLDSGTGEDNGTTAEEYANGVEEEGG